MIYNYKKLIFGITIIGLFASCFPTKKLAANEQITLTEEQREQFDSYFYEAITQKEAGAYNVALDIFRKCYEIDSLDAGLCFELGSLYAGFQQPNLAVPLFERAVKQYPDNWWYNIQLLETYLVTRQNEKAFRLAEGFQNYFPYKEETYRILEMLYKQTKQYAKAIAAYDKLEKISAINENLSLEKCALYLELKQPKKAVAEIEKLIKKYPSESKYKVALGDTYMSINEKAKALEIYRKALVADPESPFAYMSLAEYYNDADSATLASEMIRKALTIEQLEVENKIFILGQYVQKFLQDTVRFDETESLFRLLTDRYPLEEQVHAYYAVFLQFRHRQSEAISELESAIAINPKNEQTWGQLLQIYLSDKNFSKVIKLTSQAIENMPENTQWYFYKGIAQFQTDDLEGALQTDSIALSMLTDKQQAQKSDFYSQMGDIYYKMKRRDDAFTAFEDALKANPSNIYVMNNYAYYLSEENLDLRKAERMSAKTIEQEPSNSTYLDTYAWIFYKQGNFTLAKFYIERAMDNLDKEQDNSVVVEHYGDILLANGNEQKAIEMWKKSQEMGNVSEELKDKIEKYENTIKPL
ncbi:MAG: tetratricopeptide repeat protein [Paludibacter sp.]|nr:tetratricopeptide repeat protein [Paludibacter sp.]